MKGFALATTLVVSLTTALGQAPSSRPSFEAASIKLNKDGHGIHSNNSPGYLRVSGTLKSLIRVAYGNAFSSGLREEQIEGGPKWIDDEYYDIEARASGPAESEQLLEMLQSLLTERFKLQFHRGTKQLQGYNMVVVKNGLKMTPVPEGDDHSSQGGKGTMTAVNVPLSQLATNLSRQLGMPVSNETGNNEFFDFTLTWDPAKSAPSPSAADPNVSGPDASGGASIFTALQEQLGLRLEPHRVTIETIVVDNASKPVPD